LTYAVNAPDGLGETVVTGPGDGTGFVVKSFAVGLSPCAAAAGAAEVTVDETPGVDHTGPEHPPIAVGTNAVSTNIATTGQRECREGDRMTRLLSDEPGR